MRALLILSIFPILLSCRPLPPLLLLLDPYSADLLAAEGSDPASLRRALASRYRIRVELLDPQANTAVEAEKLIRAAGSKWVFLSPLLLMDADALAARLPDVLFLREQPGSPRAPNLRLLHFQRAEAFRDAGTIAARLVTRPDLRPALGEGIASVPKAGLLLAVPTPQGNEEVEAFRAAFLAEAGSDLLVERTIGSLSDTGQARRVMEQMRAEGVALFVLKTYALSGFCLEILRTGGGVCILEQSAGSRAYSAQVVLWFQEDLAGALRSLPSAPEGEPVSAPVRLRPGAPLSSLSASARAELGFPELFQ